MRALPRRSRKETGEGSTEYALLIVLIGLLVVGAIRLIGSATSTQLKRTGDTISGSSSSGGGSAGNNGGSGSGSASSGSNGGSAGSASSGGNGGGTGSGGGGSAGGGNGGNLGNPPVGVN